MRLRQKGFSQVKVSSLFFNKGMSACYGIRLERKFKRANHKAMVLFTDESDVLNDPFKLFNPYSGFNESAILYINDHFLQRGFNPLYFSRNNILRIREIKTGKRLPLNKSAIWSERLRLDSS